MTILILNDIVTFTVIVSGIAIVIVIGRVRFSVRVFDIVSAIIIVIVSVIVVVCMVMFYCCHQPLPGSTLINPNKL